MHAKEHFIAELEPLLHEAEKAFDAGNGPKARAVSHAMLLLVRDYASKLTRDEIREALNNPTANAIAKRLGIWRET